MEFQLLPPLRTKLNKEVPTAVIDKLNYLWKASTACLEREPVVVSSSSHRLTQSFMETASLHKVDLPIQILEKICGFCSVLLVPAVTCQVRLRDRSRLSRANRAKKDKLKNEVVVHCNLCQHVTKAAGYLKKSRSATLGPAVVAAEVIQSKPATLVQPEKKKFSFLNRIQGTAESSSANRRASAPGKLDNVDFLSFSSTSAIKSQLSQSNASSLQALSKGILGGGKRDAGQLWEAAPSSGARTDTGTMTLLELEALNKKKRRKSMGPNSS